MSNVYLNLLKLLKLLLCYYISNEWLFKNIIKSFLNHIGKKYKTLIYYR